MKTVVVIPTYNEATNIRAMVSDLCSLSVPDLSVLVVDDASPDGTGRIADELASESPARVRVLHRAGKSGLGTAYIAGFRSALDAGAAVIGQMDADFSHSPEYVPRLIERLADCDVVVGSRYVPGGSLDERWEYGRFLLSWFANSVYARAILGLRVRDVTAGFKFWRRNTLLGLGLDRVRSNGYIFQVEMACLAERLGYRIAEIPIHFEDRRIGKSKMTIPVKIEAAIRTFELAWRYRSISPADRRPLPDESHVSQLAG